MNSVGILAYGSLIAEPGKEIEPLIRKRIDGVRTPFPIEFARSSSKRSGGPTVVPVENGGSHVLATILVLDPSVPVAEAEDLLWRRETRNEDSDNHYTKPLTPGPNKMVVESLRNFNGLDVVIYTKLGPNITDLTPERLAELAISSARKKQARPGRTESAISFPSNVRVSLPR